MNDARERRRLSDIAVVTGPSTDVVNEAAPGDQINPQSEAAARDAAERLGYEADPIARALASGRTDTVGVLCGSLTDGWHQEVAAALGRGLIAVGRHAFTLDAGNDPEREAMLAKRLVDQRVDA